MSKYYKTVGLKLHVANRSDKIRSVFLFGAGTHFGIDLRPEDHHYSIIEWGQHKGSVQVLSISDQSSEVLIEAFGIPYIYLVDYFLHNSIKVTNLNIQFEIPDKVITKSDIELISPSVYLKLWKVNFFDNLFEPPVDMPIYIFDYVRFDEPNSIYFSTSGACFTIGPGILLELGLPSMEKAYTVNLNFDTDDL